MTSLAFFNGLPEDRSVNVWHVRTPAEVGVGSAVVAQTLVFPFATFYQAIDAYMPADSISATTGAHSAKVYSLADGGPGAADDQTVLLVDDTFTTPALAATGVSARPHPSEVAVCLSMAANPTVSPEFTGTTRPRSRRRGRVYLGPFINSGTTSETSNGGIRPIAAFRTALLNAAETLYDSLLALTVSAEICVYSRTDGELRPITEFSVDDAFDTVRSRGVEATARMIRTL